MIWLIQLLIVSLFLRSNVYFGDTSISLLNIVNIFVFAYFIFSYHKKIGKDFLIILFTLLLFLIIEFIYLLVFYKNVDQIKEFYYSSFFISLFLLIYWGVKYHGIRLIKISFNTIFILYLLMFVIVLFEIITMLHLPASRAAIDVGFANYPTTFFYNPNDFATAIVLFFPLLYYFARILGDRKKIIFITLLSICFTTVTMSRLALILLLVFPVFILFIKNKLKQFVLAIFVFIGIFILLTNLNYQYASKNDSINSRNMNKFVSIFDVSGKDKSNSQSNSVVKNVRYKVFAVIINNPRDFILGKGFLSSETLYDNKIIPIKNPHSYWAESIFNFGFIGFFPILFIFAILLVLSFYNFSKHYLYRISIVQLFYFIVLVNIPSGILCLPILWLPIAFVCAILLNPIKIDENNKICN